MTTHSTDSASVQPYHLRCESFLCPLGIEAANPRLTWRMQSSRKGATPSRYRVTVEWDGETWDSGWLVASEPSVYFTGELVPRTRYTWTVCVEDDQGNNSSAQSWFETGLVDRDELRGVWIGRNKFAPTATHDFDPPQDDDLTAKVRHLPPPINVRGTFTARSGLVKARLYSSAQGVYKAHINGLVIGDEELAPGWTDYNDRILYQAYDITENVQRGENAIGMTVADGWWSGYVGFDSRSQGCHYGTNPAAWAMIVLTYDDGAEEFIATDETWVEKPGQIVYADLLMGQYEDKRRSLGNWTAPDYSTESWAPVAVVDSDLTPLAAPVGPPVRVKQRVKAKEIFTDPDGKLIVDFGQNLVGRLRVDFGEMPRGQAVYIRHGEILDGQYLYTDNLRTAEARDVYVSAGGSENIFNPEFTFHGFRYAELHGAPAHLKVDNIVAEVIYSDTPEEGDVTTSSADVNQLISNVRWGQRSNFVSVPTDCPQRDERLGWTADAQVFTPTAAFNSDIQSFMERWLRDVRYAQTVEGSFPDVAPIVTQFFSDGAPAWGDAGTIIPWYLYRTYGDKRLLKQSYPSMCRWVDFIQANNPDLLWVNRTGKHYGDWLQIDAETSRPLLATAYFAHSAELTARTAQVLGKKIEADHYFELAQQIKEAFTAAYMQSDGTLEGNTQTCYLLALAFDLVPDTQRPAMKRKLEEAIAAHDGLLTTGFVGVSLLCPVLSEVGRSDLAYSLLETDRFPSWLYSVRQGATTIWERWDGWTQEQGFQSVEMNSFNHYSLGSVVEWIYRYVAGIDQCTDSIGYSKPLIRPVVGGSLTHAHGTYESRYGHIESGWTIDGKGNGSFSFVLPPGTQARVQLPIGNATVDGQPIAEALGISDIEVTSEGTNFAALPGTYQVEGILV